MGRRDDVKPVDAQPVEGVRLLGRNSELEKIERVANMPEYEGSSVRDIWLLRLQALLSRARSDDIAYQDLVNRYRRTAESHGFEGHIAMAEAM